ncbi:MAG TPA: hypothetical protein VMG10_33680 [Gemmataceae bacterium]|nr:hypothetical protein [Gemmataceae bacterium]
MKSSLPLAALAVLALLVSRSGASEMRDELRVDAAHYSVMRALFGTYGYRPRQTLFWETAGLRFQLPGGAEGVGQTGVYSYFALSGDCETILTYDLLNVPPPRGGYGSGVGLAFDFGGGGGRGAIQRLIRPMEGDGYVLQTVPGEFAKSMKEVDRFVPAASRQGRIGLRRVKNELIFLSADALDGPLQEIDRLPFTERTIRAVRVFADPGGSPTALDTRMSNIEIRAEEIALGVPRREQTTRSWGWVGTIVVAVGGVVAFWAWRRKRRKFYQPEA